MRKPQAGKCGKCGRAVVVDPLDPPRDSFKEIFWQGGHRYEWDVYLHDWRLTAVRCDYHGTMPGDPRGAWKELRTS